MLKKILFLFLTAVILLSGCGTLEVRREQSPNPDPTTTTLPLPAPTQLAPEVWVEQSPNSDPTATPLPIPASMQPAPDLSAFLPPYRIQFGSYATWTDVIDNLNSNQIKVYAVSAIQGQVMSVSISPGQSDSWYFLIDIRGQDGIALCPSCIFWRGVLPATQDYFIRVMAPVAGDFAMRVAINPPGQARQYFEFTDPQRGLTLGYSDEFAPTTHPPTGNRYFGAPLLILNFINPDFYFTTNLNEAFFMLNTIDDLQAKSACVDLEPGAEMRTINGRTYVYHEEAGAAAGTGMQELIYRTAHVDSCYEIVFHISSFSIGNLSPELAATYTEFDRARIVHKFEEILSTFSVR